MSLVARPKRRPQESRSSPSAMGSTAKRWPSRPVWPTVTPDPPRDTRVPACSLRVAIATLSPGAGRRPTSWKSHTRSFTAVPLLSFQTYVLATSVSQQALRLGMVTGRTRARRCGRSGRAASEASVVDVGHVLGPLTGWEVSVFLEAGQPVVRVLLPDYQERRLFLAYGESAFYLEVLLVHSASTSPSSASRGTRKVPATPDHHDAHQLSPDNLRDPTQLRQLEPDLHYISVQEHLVGAEGDVRVGEASSGRDVVFEPVPGAGHDLTLVHPLELPVVLAPGDQGAQGRLALAQRTRLMWTDVGEAVELAADVEDPDLTLPYLHDLVRAHREIREVAQDVLLALATHRTPRRLPQASMLKSRRAFSPKILRLTSFVKGIWCTFEGWSKSWCGQSEAKMVLSSPS